MNITSYLSYECRVRENIVAKWPVGFFHLKMLREPKLAVGARQHCATAAKKVEIRV